MSVSTHATASAATAEERAAAEELRAELRTVARDLLAGLPAGDEDGATDGWASFADAGWLGLEVPDELDGAGVGFAETAVVCQELGRAAARAPYLGTAVLGAGALLALVPGETRDGWLRALATGAPRLAPALPTGDAAVGKPEALPFQLVAAAGGGWRVSGHADFVPDAAEAGTVLLLAAAPDGEPVLVAVEPSQPGVRIADQPVLDVSRGLGTVTVTDATVGEVHRFGGDGQAAVRTLLARGALALAADSLGVAEAMLDATVAYVGVRHQFGRAIGSFQAVKHGCADMFVQVSVSRGLVADAVRALAALGPGGLDGDLAAAEIAVSRAKSYVGGAAVDVAGKAMQLHGGIGYTWESGVHRFLKRAAGNRALFGSPTAHRARLAHRFV
ncbi:acyl-CoA/acyl-ACP dehydrogenase [Frankia sp. AgB1.9]|uniref:acyl-CoA dehydrogenase family protein n=1 Tax=unclassified Frankia TaxID=2632575 RepID=UPI0019341476|nr:MULTISPECIES: acyl-CoA dehydrogenase family protein [unclassified Frankia]MBL7488220.1 acyl-CoA/acyl-ACP dehydrogenase [Frankia sp. AgW1.1]MBL7548137.1 acyl-CoA/acyl-ACP dehydrogenase [Frankia sp. AgB1.9]MBL7620363.1 acyl-CoA/acyl-ACP dehydrogenase [Frankia sp. AgB1.8]